MSDFAFVICADCGYANAVKSGDRIRCRDCDSVWEGRKAHHAWVQDDEEVEIEGEE